MYRHTSLMNWLVRATLMITTLPILAGCSTMVARSGISVLSEIPQGLSRKEVQERYGSSASSGTTILGRQIEVYYLRQKFKGPMYSNYGGGGGYGALGIFILAETVGFPIALAISEKNKLEVAFVYGPDDHVLYFYEPKAESQARYDQALGTLTHPLSNEAELAKCASARECMKRYVEELQRRAEEIGLGHTLDLYFEENFGRDFELAKDLDDGKITKQEILKLRNGSRKYP